MKPDRSLRDELTSLGGGRDSEPKLDTFVFHKYCNFYRVTVISVGVEAERLTLALGWPDREYLRPSPPQRQTRDPLHVVRAEVGIPLGHR